MKKFIYHIVFALKIHWLLRFLLRKRTIILVYHGLTDQETHDGIENYDAKHLNIKRFATQMHYLRRHYHVISLDRWLEHRATGSALPSNVALITFDDGYHSNYRLAYPILKKLSLPATIFLTTEFIEERKYLWVDQVEYAFNHSQVTHLDLDIGSESLRFSLDPGRTESVMLSAARLKSKLKSLPQHSQATVVENLERKLGHSLSEAKNIPSIYEPLAWSEIREMLESGLISVGSHTHRHLILSRLRTQEARQELLTSKELIESTTGNACRLFCYPNGEEGDFNTQTKRLLQETGYLCGLTAVEGFNDETSDSFELKRLGVSNHAEDIEFIMTLVGVKTWLSDIKKKWGQVLT